MASRWHGRWLGAAVLLAAAFGIVRAAEPAPTPNFDSGYLKGDLLIASSQMQDPRFYHAVILLIAHDSHGAFGIVINRPIEERPIKSLLAATGGDAQPGDDTIAGKIWVYAGGPVQPQFGFVVHSADYHGAGTIDLGGQVAMTGTAQILRDIGHDKGPKQRFFAVGYAGWGPGQLEGEIARHDWFTARDDPDLIFDAPPGEVWKRALDQRMRQL